MEDEINYINLNSDTFHVRDRSSSSNHRDHSIDENVKNIGRLSPGNTRNASIGMKRSGESYFTPSNGHGHGADALAHKNPRPGYLFSLQSETNQRSSDDSPVEDIFSDTSHLSNMSSNSLRDASELKNQQKSYRNLRHTKEGQESVWDLNDVTMDCHVEDGKKRESHLDLGTRTHILRRNAEMVNLIETALNINSKLEDLITAVIGITSHVLSLTGCHNPMEGMPIEDKLRTITRTIIHYLQPIHSISTRICSLYNTALRIRSLSHPLEEPTFSYTTDSISKQHSGDIRNDEGFYSRLIQAESNNLSGNSANENSTQLQGMLDHYQCIIKSHILPDVCITTPMEYFNCAPIHDAMFIKSLITSTPSTEGWNLIFSQRIRDPLTLYEGVNFMSNHLPRMLASILGVSRDRIKSVHLSVTTITEEQQQQQHKADAKHGIIDQSNQKMSHHPEPLNQWNSCRSIICYEIEVMTRFFVSDDISARTAVSMIEYIMSCVKTRENSHRCDWGYNSHWEKSLLDMPSLWKTPSCDLNPFWSSIELRMHPTGVATEYCTQYINGTHKADSWMLSEKLVKDHISTDDSSSVFDDKCTPLVVQTAKLPYSLHGRSVKVEEELAEHIEMHTLTAIKESRRIGEDREHEINGTHMGPTTCLDISTGALKYLLIMIDSLYPKPIMRGWKTESYFVVVRVGATQMKTKASKTARWESSDHLLIPIEWYPTDIKLYTSIHNIEFVVIAEKKSTCIKTPSSGTSKDTSIDPSHVSTPGKENRSRSVTDSHVDFTLQSNEGANKVTSSGLNAGRVLSEGNIPFPTFSGKKEVCIKGEFNGKLHCAIYICRDDV